MANALLWDALPSAEVVMATDDVAPAGLRDADSLEILISPADTEVTNGTGLKMFAMFELYIVDFDAAPTAGGYCELHIMYQLDGTNYADGEDGDVADPNLSAATLVGVFPIFAGDEDQRVQLGPIQLQPFDFRVALVNKCGQAIADSDGSFLKIYRYTPEVQ